MFMSKKLLSLIMCMVIVSIFIISGCTSTATNTADLSQEIGEEGTEYIIGPGDNIEVYVWRHADLSRSVPVRPDGKVSTPLIEDMIAVGKTPSELARDMEIALTKFIKKPRVNIIVTDFVGQFAEQIRVVGQAANPQSLAYREKISLLDVIIEVGGLTEFAAGNRAKIVRRYGGEQKEIAVRIDDLINKGDISKNVTMYPGDILIIPESFF